MTEDQNEKLASLLSQLQEAKATAQVAIAIASDAKAYSDEVARERAITKSIAELELLARNAKKAKKEAHAAEATSRQASQTYYAAMKACDEGKSALMKLIEGGV